MTKKIKVYSTSGIAPEVTSKPIYILVDAKKENKKNV
jgi:hypothetical protein